MPTDRFSCDKIAINASGCRFGLLRRNNLLLSVSNVVVVHILLLSRGFKLPRALYIGFNILINLYNQRRGTRGPKEPFSRIPCYNRYVYKKESDTVRRIAISMFALCKNQISACKILEVINRFASIIKMTVY
jgi:hypothetical protein